MIDVTKGQILNKKYCLLEELGSGGGGRVFLAVDLVLEKRWAIKIFEYSASDSREISILKELDHPMIPRLVEYIMGEHYTGVVMDYLDGADLGTLCQNGRSFSAAQVVEIGLEVCEVLMYLHEHQPPILFRDLKPHNLMMTREGHIKLIDFGCACLEERQQFSGFAGTKGYAAPEQYEGICSPRSDIYSLGVTMEVLCSGKKPGKLRRILKKCRQKKPDRRYETVRQVQEKLESCQKAMEGAKRPYRLALAVSVILLLLPMVQLIVATGSEAAYLEFLERKDYRQAVHLIPEREQAYLELLKDGAQKGQTVSAIRTVEMLLQMYPQETLHHDEVRLTIAGFYARGNSLDDEFSADYEKAYEWYRKTADKKFPEVQWMKRILKIVEESAEQTDWKTAAEVMRSAYREVKKRKDPKERRQSCEFLASLWLTNRYYLEQVGEDPLQESIALAAEGISLAQEWEKIDGSQVLTLKMTLAQSYYLRGALEVRKEDLKESIRLYEEVFQRTESKGARRSACQKLAYVWEELQNYEQAEVWYTRLIKEVPKEVDYYCSYALMELLHRKDRTKAKELYTSAGKLPGAKENRNYLILKERLEERG